MPLEQVSNINFKAEEIQQSFKHKPVIDWINKVGKSILIFLQVVILILVGINFYYSRYLNNIKIEFQDLKEKTQSPEQIEKIQKYQGLQTKIEEIENIEKTRINWKERLDILGGKIPNDLTIKEYTYAAESLSITAKVASVQGFALFIQKLRGDNQIKSISLLESEYDSETKYFSFKMDIGL
jgi:hypothetical protein